MKIELKANELRLGNWIMHEGDPIKISHITESAFSGIPLDLDLVYDDIEKFFPIPLTPEILEACGFDKGEGVSSTWEADNQITTKREIYHFGCLSIEILNGEFLASISAKRGTAVTIDRKIKFLHELQNLFNALTGEELEIKNLQLI